MLNRPRFIEPYNTRPRILQVLSKARIILLSEVAHQ